jgi:hypothetical protein
MWKLLKHLSLHHSWLWHDVELLQEYLSPQLLEKLGQELPQRAYASLELLPPRVLVPQQIHLRFRYPLLTYFS